MGKSYWQKAILLLAAAHPTIAMKEFALLSIGQRNAKLFRFRDSLFGTDIEAHSQCPTCAEKVEFQLNSQVICDPNVAVWDGGERKIDIDHHQIICRPPSSHDLEAISPYLEVEDDEGAAYELIKSCVFQWLIDGVYTPIESMPITLIERVSDDIKNMDPHSEIICRLACPECEHSWGEPFDIASFLWREIENKAQIILSEVQLLARAFGWWEGDILSLSDVRRKYYIEQLHE
ncbi:hypothetical protein [uncultured Shewanella sp.]|uniref:hypothetical protein n=1 Tax=uncultured Shewanella sp. TaxID=173975 RepID=UPI0026289740|nr:hypothetical protein [uncultured Shewanella sp.]